MVQSPRLREHNIANRIQIAFQICARLSVEKPDRITHYDHRDVEWNRLPILYTREADANKDAASFELSIGTFLHNYGPRGFWSLRECPEFQTCLRV